MSNSSTSRYESENRRYQRTLQTMISGSKCRHLNSAGRGLIMEHTAAYQTHSLSLGTQPFRHLESVTLTAFPFVCRAPLPENNRRGRDRHGSDQER